MIRSLAGSPFVRVLAIAGLVLLLQIPSCLVGQLGFERQRSRDQATADIVDTWGGGQHVAGPLLLVPYRVTGRDAKGNTIELESGTVAVLAERLDVTSEVAVETRRRGLFEVPVYRTQLQLQGRFKAPLAEIGTLVPRESLDWKRAQVALRLGDVRAIDRLGPLRWAGKSYEFQGGSGLLPGTGLHAPLAGETGAAPIEFSFDLAVRGSNSLHFGPTARATSVDLRADWPHPKFGGAWLPERHDIGPQGFSAHWSVTSLAGGLPAAWKCGGADLDAARFGVDLLFPVDPYRMSERTQKYDLLFIGLTFVVVWLFELVGGRVVHPMQYLLVGASLCVFYLLQLALAEHFGFAVAYAVAATAVTGQVFLYARSALRGWGPAFVLMLAVATLYALLYLLLGVEDYALLIGSGALFVVLSAVMFLTRRVEWGALLKRPEPVR